MSVDQYLDRRYNRLTYNCAHLCYDAWLGETGERLDDALGSFLKTPEDRTATLGIRSQLRLLKEPVSPCIVLFRRPPFDPHVGIYLRGKVLHITERGVAYQPLEIAGAGFKQVSLYGSR